MDSDAIRPGFWATKGWDPISGLGTPNYQKLLELFMSMKRSMKSRGIYIVATRDDCAISEIITSWE